MKFLKSKMLLLIAFLLIGMVVSAQNLVTGVVTDTGGTPLPGVNIMLLTIQQLRSRMLDLLHKRSK